MIPRNLIFIRHDSQVPFVSANNIMSNCTLRSMVESWRRLRVEDAYRSILRCGVHMHATAGLSTKHTRILLMSRISTYEKYSLTQTGHSLTSDRHAVDCIRWVEIMDVRGTETGTIVKKSIIYLWNTLKGAQWSSIVTYVLWNNWTSRTWS